MTQAKTELSGLQALHLQNGSCRVIPFHVQMTEGQFQLRKGKKRSIWVCVMDSSRGRDLASGMT